MSSGKFLPPTLPACEFYVHSQTPTLAPAIAVLHARLTDFASKVKAFKRRSVFPGTLSARKKDVSVTAVSADLRWLAGELEELRQAFEATGEWFDDVAGRGMLTGEQAWTTRCELQNFWLEFDGAVRGWKGVEEKAAEDLFGGEPWAEEVKDEVGTA